jgi:hypothetical protein
VLKRSIIGLVFMAVAAAPAFAAAPPARGGDTVNDYTPAQEQRARAAATRQGYRVDKVIMAQDGNLNFTATKGGQNVQLTVTREGQVYAATAIPPATPAPGAAAAPAPRTPPAR